MRGGEGEENKRRVDRLFCIGLELCDLFWVLITRTEWVHVHISRRQAPLSSVSRTAGFSGRSCPSHRAMCARDVGHAGRAGRTLGI